MPTTATQETVPAFNGFSRDAIDFLVELAQHNERAWFQPRKADYERLLKEPLELLCIALADEFVARGVPLASDPKRSPFRIYRDVRFSKDKSPYQIHLSASFPWKGDLDEPFGAGAGEGAIGGYFHLQPGEVFVGGGMYHPSPARLAGWRAAVIADRARVRAILEDPAFREAYEAIDGDRLKRAPAGFPADDPDVELLKLKDVIFRRRLPDESVLSPDLPTTIAESLDRATPLLRLLAGLT